MYISEYICVNILQSYNFFFFFLYYSRTRFCPTLFFGPFYVCFFFSNAIIVVQFRVPVHFCLERTLHVILLNLSNLCRTNFTTVVKGKLLLRFGVRLRARVPSNYARPMVATAVQPVGIMYIDKRRSKLSFFWRGFTVTVFPNCSMTRLTILFVMPRQADHFRFQTHNTPFKPQSYVVTVHVARSFASTEFQCSARKRFMALSEVPTRPGPTTMVNGKGEERMLHPPPIPKLDSFQSENF